MCDWQGPIDFDTVQIEVQRFQPIGLGEIVSGVVCPDCGGELVRTTIGALCEDCEAYVPILSSSAVQSDRTEEK